MTSSTIVQYGHRTTLSSASQDDLPQIWQNPLNFSSRIYSF